MSAAGGFLLASRGAGDLRLGAAALAGISLVVAAGAVCNNCIDRDIDARMERTRNRAMPRGLVSIRAALAYAALLGLAGEGLLLAGAGRLPALLAALGFLVYVGLYSLLLKRRSVHGTLVGSLSGAVPPVAGYCAASGGMDGGALLLFLMFALWQMPHSYAVAILRLDDYKAAGIPVGPVRLGVAATRRHILYYILAFTLAAAMMTAGGYTGYAYLAVTAASGAYWFALALAGRRAADTRAWARGIFVCSLFTIMVLNIMMSLDFGSVPGAAGLPGAFVRWG